MDYPSLRFESKNDSLVWRKPNRHILAHISSYEGLFELSFYALKLCTLALRFAYNKPYDFAHFIFTL